MIEIIQKWLINRLGLIPDLQPDNFLELAQNGKIIAQILENYQIINHEQLKLIEESTNSLTVYNHLNIWLRKIRINFSENELFELSQGKNEQLIYDLFYQLYETLNDKSSLYFISEQQKNYELPNKNGRFQVTPVNNSLLDDFFIESNPLSEPIKQNWDIINWHHDHLESLKQQLKQNHENYQKYLKAKNKEEKEDEILSFFPSNYADDYQGLLQQQQQVLESPKFEENLKKSKQILRKIQNKHEKARLRKNVVDLLQKQVFEKLLKNLEEESEKFWDKTISEKLLKQSNQEKEMVLKLFEIKLQKDNFIENRRLLNEALNKEKENEFIQNLSSNNNQLDYYVDVERNLELHKKIYEDKLRLRAEKRRNFCEKIVYDFVDVALKFIEHKTEFNLDPSRSLLKDWGTLFIKGLPILENHFPTHTERNSFSYSESNNEDFSLLLDENELEIYLNITQTDEIYCGMNVLGFIVHRLLSNKYLPPPPPPKPKLPQVEYAISVNGLNLELELGFLQKLLTEINCKLIQIEDIVNYCLEAYQTEISPNNAKEVSELAVDEKKSKQDKQIQANAEEIRLTRKAELGSIVYEEINLGKPLDNQLLVEMFVEYLRNCLPSKTNGWVLLNYPTCIEEVAALEEELTAIRIPKKYYNQYDAKADEWERKKLSKLVPNPSPIEGPPYQAYLNGFLKIENDLKGNGEEKKCQEIIKNKDENEDKKTEEKFLKESRENLEKFYKDQNCFFSFYYEKIDAKAIKEIIEFILTLPKKPIEVPTPQIIDEKLVETDKKGVKGKKSKNDKKKEKTPKNSAKKSEKTTKSDKNTPKKEPQSLTKEDKGTQIPEISIVEQSPKEVFEPGQFGYTYLNLPMRLELEMQLATFWENTEKKFTENLKNSFNVKREQLNTITPYLSAIKREMIEYITNRPNEIEIEIKQFHQIFADYDKESLNEEQTELRCRLDEFREKMFDICDNRLKENEIKRNQFMKEEENWMSLKQSELFSIYVNIFQLEMNRFVETIQLLNDYYTIILMNKKNPQIFFETIQLNNNEKIELCYEKLLKFVDSTQLKAWNILDELYEGLTEIQGKTKKTKLKCEYNDEIILQIFNEWKCGFYGELARCRLHLELIGNEADKLNKEINERIETFFNELLDTISKRYQTEINKVEESCDILEILMEIIDEAMEIEQSSVNRQRGEDSDRSSSSS